MITMTGVASSTPSPLAFDAIGPFQFTPPDKFDGKKENFEEFAFKLKPDLYLMDPGYMTASREIEDNPDKDITDESFVEEDGDPKTQKPYKIIKKTALMAPDSIFLLVRNCNP